MKRKTENTLPFPWNPLASPPHSVAHLFVMAELNGTAQPNGRPSMAPMPACYFSISPKTDPAYNKKLRMAKI